ncbi:MAG TPA: 30S ribosomal protein S18 [Dehalococcoidia bacterium]
METERTHVAEAPGDGLSEPRYMRSPEPRGDFGSRRSEGGSDDRPRRGPPAAGDDERPRRRGGRRRRVCIMCADHVRYVDYKNVSFLRRFISDRARIETRRKSSACAKHQRALATAIKRARHLALLPYTAEHIRVSQGR